MNLIIERDKGYIIETKGRLIVDSGIQNLFECLTLELPFLNNQKGISCIPVGTYSWKKVGASNIPYDHISIPEVENRSGICIHYGNFAAGDHPDIKGCILTGNKYADINGDGFMDILNSKKTFEKMMSLLPDSGKLIII